MHIHTSTRSLWTHQSLSVINGHLEAGYAFWFQDMAPMEAHKSTSLPSTNSKLWIRAWQDLCSNIVLYHTILYYIILKGIISDYTCCITLYFTILSCIMWYYHILYYIIYYIMLFLSLHIILPYITISYIMLYCTIYYITFYYIILYYIISYDIIWYDVIWYDMIWYDVYIYIYINPSIHPSIHTYIHPSIHPYPQAIATRPGLGNRLPTTFMPATWST